MFLELPKRTVLVDVEMLDVGFYTQSELRAIVSREDFYSWSQAGYYIVKEVKYVEDTPSDNR